MSGPQENESDNLRHPALPRLILKVIKTTPGIFEHLPAELRDDRELLLPLDFG